MLYWAGHFLLSLKTPIIPFTENEVVLDHGQAIEPIGLLQARPTLFLLPWARDLSLTQMPSL